MSTKCERCGGPLEVFEGEAFCPDCTSFEAAQAHDRATSEALALLAQNFPEPAAIEEEIPF